MNFGHVRHLHFLGVGGVGMCGLAELLHGEGFTVSGCDLAASETTARLDSLGIRVDLGHAAGDFSLLEARMIHYHVIGSGYHRRERIEARIIRHNTALFVGALVPDRNFRPYDCGSAGVRYQTPDAGESFDLAETQQIRQG